MEKIRMTKQQFENMSFKELIELLNDYVITNEQAKQLVIDFINKDDYVSAYHCMEELGNADYYVKGSESENKDGLLPLEDKSDIYSMFVDVSEAIRVIELD